MTAPEVHSCARCGRPMRHDTAVIDSPCANLLRGRLEMVASIAGDITLTVAKFDRVNRSGGYADDLGWWKTGNALEAIPLPYRPDAAQRHDAAVLELNGWTKVIGGDRGFNVPLDDEWHPLRRIALYLIGNLEYARHQPWADEAWPAILAACSELVRIVDTKAPGELIGMCSCGTARYSNEQACPRCRSEDLAYSRADLDAGRDDLIVTASEAARYVADSGLVRDTTKLRKLIWAWADRGHLTPLDDVPRYRLGDVLERVLASPALLRAA